MLIRLIYGIIFLMARKNKQSAISAKFGERHVGRSFMLVALSVFFVVLIIFILGYRFVASTPIFFAPTPTPTPFPTLSILPPEAVDVSREDYVNKAKETLAGKLNINVQEINLVSAEKREWGDTSLGCPEGGKFYSQVITQGYLIVLSAKDNNYTYHAGVGRVVSCEN